MKNSRKMNKCVARFTFGGENISLRMRLEKVILLAAAAIGLIWTISKLEITHRRATRRKHVRQEALTPRAQVKEQPIVDNNHPPAQNSSHGNNIPEVSLLKSKMESFRADKAQEIYAKTAAQPSVQIQPPQKAPSSIKKVTPKERLNMVDVQKLGRNLDLLESELNSLKSRPRRP